ncbi:MAG: hypothetical protein ACTHMY_01600 [Solirubrobacteraceae bacterium]
MPGSRLSRADIDRFISDTAAAFGWLHHRARVPGLTRDGYPDGFPPHVLLRNGQLVLVTIAGRDRSVTPNERVWVDQLRASPVIELLVIAESDLGDMARTLGASGAVEPRAPPVTRTSNVRPLQRGGRE